jgi:hypothetical protein
MWRRVEIVLTDVSEERHRHENLKSYNRRDVGSGILCGSALRLYYSTDRVEFS